MLSRRGTVPRIGSRAERWSGKKVFERSGMNLGWFCMSWRQPARANTPAASSRNPRRNCAGALIRHLRDGQGAKAVKKTPGLVRREPGVLWWNAEEQPVAARAGEIGRVEYVVARRGQMS